MNSRMMYGVTAAIMVMALSSRAGAGSAHRISVHGVTFETSMPFSAPQKAGLNAVLVMHPKNAEMGKETISIMAILYSADQKKQMESAGVNLLDYSRSTFMGSASKGTPVNRSFAGKSIHGERFSKKIPHRLTAEVYIVPLKNGVSLALGFQWSPSVTDEAANRLMNEAAASLKE